MRSNKYLSIGLGDVALERYLRTPVVRRKREADDENIGDVFGFFLARTHSILDT